MHVMMKKLRNISFICINLILLSLLCFSSGCKDEMTSCQPVAVMYSLRCTKVHLMQKCSFACERQCA